VAVCGGCVSVCISAVVFVDVHGDST
jgi:hypothetical protein